MAPGEPISYTDGEGTLGTGSLRAESVLRGDESKLAPAPVLELAVAPPHERDRLRWLVEKAGELEVHRLRWLKTRFGHGRAHLLPKAQEWAVPALEQSRGAWLTRVDGDLVEPGELNDGLLTVVADRGGGSFPSLQPLRVMVGPEGGWAPGEVDSFPTVVGLGRNVLRTETAAIVAAGLFRARR
ncbi:hypothetical protein BH18ACT5_BH18ACT5_18050 [soil metagenome]